MNLTGYKFQMAATHNNVIDTLYSYFYDRGLHGCSKWEGCERRSAIRKDSRPSSDTLRRVPTWVQRHLMKRPALKSLR